MRRGCSRCASCAAIFLGESRKSKQLSHMLCTPLRFSSTVRVLRLKDAAAIAGYQAPSPMKLTSRRFHGGDELLCALLRAVLCEPRCDHCKQKLNPFILGYQAPPPVRPVSHMFYGLLSNELLHRLREQPHYDDSIQFRMIVLFGSIFAYLVFSCCFPD